MPIIDKHPNGSFCWMELHTSNQNSAKQFYTKLFGWEVHDFPMGPEMIYTIFRLKGKDCSAACTQVPQEIEMGAPPHWTLYIATDNVDESTAKAKELGATVIAEPFDVGTNGRMSVIQDPAKAFFCLWQGNQTPGIGIANEDNAYCWADHNSHDRDGAQKFYGGLLGWTFSAGKDKDGKEKDPSGYTHITNGKDMIGGMVPPAMLPPEVHPHWLIYYLVSDCDAMTTKAHGLGARTVIGPMDIEGAGRMTILQDPQGAIFAIFKSMM